MHQLSDASCGTVEIGPGRRVRRLGYGAMRLAGEGVWGPPPDPAGAQAVLRRVVELGVNLIDTADAYGPEDNERLIAEALHPYDEDLLIATKGGLTRSGPGQWEPCGRPEHLRRACDASLVRLRLDQIGLYQLHTPDPDVPFAESVGALAQLAQEGKIAAVGLSNVSLDQLATARSIVPIASVQNRYNVRERDSEAVLRACEDAGIAFLPYFPLSGFGFTRGTAALDEIGTHHDVSAAEVALAWLLARSPVMAPIPGTTSIAHLEANVAAASLKLSDSEIEQLDAFRPELSSIVRSKLATPLSGRARRRIREQAGPLRRLWSKLRSRS